MLNSARSGRLSGDMQHVRARLCQHVAMAGQTSALQACCECSPGEAGLRRALTPCSVCAWCHHPRFCQQQDLFWYGTTTVHLDCAIMHCLTILPPPTASCCEWVAAGVEPFAWPRHTGGRIGWPGCVAPPGCALLTLCADREQASRWGVDRSGAERRVHGGSGWGGGAVVCAWE